EGTLRAAARFHEERAVVRLLVEVVQEDGFDLLVAQRPAAEVPDDADDLDGGLGVRPDTHSDVSANRIQAIEIPLCKTLADDHRLVGPWFVAEGPQITFREVAPGNQLRSDRREESWADAHPRRGAGRRQTG